MSGQFKLLMQRATQLTRSGLLREATALIQSALRGADAPLGRKAAPEPASSGRVFDMERAALPEPAVTPAYVGMPPPAAPPERPESRFMDGAFTAHALSRKYKLFVPGGATASMPLVVMLHGCTQDPDDFAAGTQMNQLATESGFLVLYPAQGRDGNPNRCWNWFSAGNQQRGRGEPGLIADLALHIVHEYGLDPGRVYVAGLSAGGAMAAILADQYPDVFAAAGVHSGLPRGAAQSVTAALGVMRNGQPRSAAPVQGHRAPVPLIVFHGDADSTVNPGNGQTLVTQHLEAAAQQGLYAGQPPQVEHAVAPGGAPYDVSRFMDDSGACLVEYWNVHGSGHAWSGGSDDGSYTDARGPDASKHMLAFFLARNKRAG